MKENRHTHRLPFDSFVEFSSTNCRHVCELVDISLQGALIAACSGATPGAETPCTLKISLDDAGKNQITMHGRVAYKIENRVGIYCDSIDLDSMAHLRKLVEYNLGDVELVKRDLAALVHYHNK